MLSSAATLALFASMMPLASAHYFFDKLVVAGQASPDYVRSNTRPTAYMPTKWKNTFDNTTPDSIDFRCNVGATNKAAKATAKVKTGDSLAMTLGVGATMKHPGPMSVYMSKAPTTASAYDGSGDWFLIYQEGICRQNGDIKGDAWCSWDKDRISFKIPTGIADGDYLVRAEHVGVHGAHDGQAEFYYGCAQVTVSGGGNVTPSDTVKIPGVYKKDDPAVNFSVWGGMKAYPKLGPKIFTGAASAASNDAPTSPAAAPSSKPVSSVAPVASSKPVSSAAPVASQAPAPSVPASGSCGYQARRHARDISL